MPLKFLSVAGMFGVRISEPVKLPERLCQERSCENEELSDSRWLHVTVEFDGLLLHFAQRDRCVVTN
jgi:hypothetical protein